MIEFEEARALVLSALKTRPPESVLLAEALGRTLAKDIKTRENIPPFTKATMDGYAVRAEDIRPAGKDAAVELEVLEDLPAGRVSRRSVGPDKPSAS